MTSYAKIRTEAVILEPINPTLNPVPDNSMFSNMNNSNGITLKDNSSVTAPISTGSSETSYFVKPMQAAVVIAINTPVAKRGDGKIVPVDRDDPNAKKPIGVTTQAAVNVNDIITVFLTGPNLPGMLAGKGFAPGDEIYSDNVPGGMVNDISTLNVQTDAVLRLGIADCASGAASAVAVDLILSMEVISQPSGV